MPVTAALAVSQIGGTVANTISGIKDVAKRREVETAIQRLSYEDQKKLNEKMARATTQNERLSLLVGEVNKFNVEKIKEQGKKDTRNAIIIIGGSFLFLIAVVILTKRKNA